MTAHPFMVAGTGRFGTALGDAAGDRIFAKTGASRQSDLVRLVAGLAR